MDEFYRSLFDEEPEQVFVGDLPEIQDAIQRVLLHTGIRRGYMITLGTPVTIAGSAARQLEIVIILNQGPLPKRCDYLIWVDDFELIISIIPHLS